MINQPKLEEIREDIVNFIKKIKMLKLFPIKMPHILAFVTRTGLRILHVIKGLT
jgi:hypothetical protein